MGGITAGRLSGRLGNPNYVQPVFSTHFLDCRSVKDERAPWIAVGHFLKAGRAYRLKQPDASHFALASPRYLQPIGFDIPRRIVRVI